MEFSDELLAHLQALISAKLRRSEGFMLSWSTTTGKTQRTCIWVHASIPLAFRFAHPQRRPLNADLLNELAVAAASSTGLDISDLISPQGAERVRAEAAKDRARLKAG